MLADGQRVIIQDLLVGLEFRFELAIGVYAYTKNSETSTKAAETVVP
jgi:hypothetical protein